MTTVDFARGSAISSLTTVLPETEVQRSSKSTPPYFGQTRSVEMRPVAVGNEAATGSMAAPCARWTKYVQRRLREMLETSRESNDNYPSKSTIAAAWKSAQQTFPPHTPSPSVVPGEDGSVQFVWHKARWDVALEVNTQGSLMWAYNQTTGEMLDGPLPEFGQRLVDLLAHLAAS